MNAGHLARAQMSDHDRDCCKVVPTDVFFKLKAWREYDRKTGIKLRTAKAFNPSRHAELLACFRGFGLLRARQTD